MVIFDLVSAYLSNSHALQIFSTELNNTIYSRIKIQSKRSKLKAAFKSMYILKVCDPFKKNC